MFGPPRQLLQWDHAEVRAFLNSAHDAEIGSRYGRLSRPKRPRFRIKVVKDDDAVGIDASKSRGDVGVDVACAMAAVDEDKVETFDVGAEEGLRAVAFHVYQIVDSQAFK